MNKKRYVKNGKSIKKLSTWKFSWIVLLAVAALVFSPEKNISNEAESTSTLPSAYETSAAVESVITIQDGSYFEVHFIDVGQADAALILCDDQSLLIDGGNVADSDLMYRYLQKLEVTHLDYVVATHAHEDHVGGLAGALNYATVETVYCPVTDYDSNAFKNFKKYAENAGAEITVPEVGDLFEVGSATAHVIGVNGGSDTNDTSIVLHIVYGETSFLFTGDAEREAEQAILDSGYDISSSVLKVGHHGSKNSTTYPFLREIMPSYAIISVGKDNSYGHPTEEALGRLKDANVKVYRTDMQGDIVVSSDGQNLDIQVSRNANADTLAY